MIFRANLPQLLSGNKLKVFKFFENTIRKGFKFDKPMGCHQDMG
mgnify:CR=1 FL=1